MQRVKLTLFVFMLSFVGLEAQTSKGIKSEPEMIPVKGGTYTIGCTSEQRDCDSDESPAVEVTVKDFEIGKYEVTQALWEQVMGNNPSKFQGANHPVESISWYDAIEFCNKLSELSGLEPAYKIDKSVVDPNNHNSDDKLKWTVEFNKDANGYRLPLESEWEFAARGGSKAKKSQSLYSGSDDIGEVAWYYENSDKKSHEVGSKSPNALGIYDLSGNVWEWCWSWKENYNTGSISDPNGPKSGKYRVYRGGGWFSESKYSRVSARSAEFPQYKDNSLGLRLFRNK